MQLLSLHLVLFLYFTLYSMYFFLYFCTRFDNEIQYKTTLIVRRTGLSSIFTWSVCFLPQDFHFPLVTVQNFGQKPKRTLSLFNLSSFPAFRVSLDFVQKLAFALSQFHIALVKLQRALHFWFLYILRLLGCSRTKEANTCTFFLEKNIQFTTLCIKCLFLNE